MTRGVGWMGVLVALGVGMGSWIGGAPVVEPAPQERPQVDQLSERDQRALRDLARLAQLARMLGHESVVAEDPFGREVAQAARYFLANRAPGFRDDCSGFVSAVLTEVGAPSDGIVVTLWDVAVDTDGLHWELVPRIGDLVFFDNTYDRNGNGAWDDEMSHIGVVIDVEPDGTAVIAHAGTSAGRSTIRMNLRRPNVRMATDGRVINGVLRGGHTTADLWTAFATVDPERWRVDTSEY